MQVIDERALETDLGSRFAYLGDFIGLGESDIAAIHASAEHLGPLVPSLVDAVYDKLQQYDATWRHFVPRQHGFDGATAESVKSLATDSESIEFRKQHLGRYLKKLVTAPYDGNLVDYLDRVGAMHTQGQGSPVINVPLVQMNALMGFVADAFVATIMSLGLPRDAEIATLRAFTKLLWLQNDLINRHYAAA